MVKSVTRDTVSNVSPSISGRASSQVPENVRNTANKVNSSVADTFKKLGKVVLFGVVTGAFTVGGALIGGLFSPVVGHVLGGIGGAVVGASIAGKIIECISGGSDTHQYDGDDWHHTEGSYI